MNLDELHGILKDIRCEVGGVVWSIFAGEMGNGFYVQLRYIEPDIETGEPADQHSRKWYVSAHSVKSEVVQTVLKACLTSAEHQVREHFLYKGARIFGPHFSVEELVTLAERRALDVRPPQK